VSVYNDAKAEGNDPNLKNTAQLFADGVTVKKQFGQVATALGLASSESGESAGALAKILDKAPDANSVLGTVFDVMSTVKDAKQGKDADATFSALSGVSGLLGTGAADSALDFAGDTLGITLGDATLGSLAGPIGIGIGLAVALGQGIYDKIKEETQYETPATTKFLEGAGLNPQAAKALTQEGAGYSAMPVIAKYAELNGYNLNNKADQQQFAHWLNGLNAGQLRVLVAQATTIQAILGGDTSKFTHGSASQYPTSGTRDWYDHTSLGQNTTAFWWQAAMGAIGIQLPKAPS